MSDGEGVLLDEGTIGPTHHYCDPPRGPKPHARWRCSCGVVWTAVRLFNALPGFRYRVDDYNAAVWRSESWWEGWKRRRSEEKSAEASE